MLFHILVRQSSKQKDSCRTKETSLFANIKTVIRKISNENIGLYMTLKRESFHVQGGFKTLTKCWTKKSSDVSETLFHPIPSI